METKYIISPVIIPETKEIYEAPVIQVVEVKVEQGVQMSGRMGDNPNETDPWGTH